VSESSERLTPVLDSLWIFAPILAVFLLSGCASRRTVTSAPPPAATSTGAEPAAGAPTPSPPPSAPSAAQPPTRPTPFIPGVFVEEGIASWYGVPFHGRRAADGEIFDMNSLVAAHRTLPFGTILRVTNLNNGREVQVRVIDRGPFVADRILDVAHAAAVALGMVGTGTARVRIELVSGPNPETGEFAVQVGAFADRGNAERLRDRLIARYQPIFIQDYGTSTGHLYRVEVGRESSPEAAQQLAAQLRSSDGLQVFVIRLDSTPDLGPR
jgi:rare lipoprotein A